MTAATASMMAFVRGKSALPASLIIGALVVLTFSNTLRVPLLLDDSSAIVQNASIGDLSRIGTVLSPQSGGIIAGRPLLNLTFAVNYAVSGSEVQSYHVLNITIHVVAALTLFGLVRRTLLGPRLSRRYGRDAGALAFCIAAFWALHPLHTNCVTYISQRAESLMGLFYLLTLYCFVRSATVTAPRRWQILSVLACVCGMATKEVMVTAPLMVLLFDLVFSGAPLRQVLAKRAGYYGSLASTWAFLACLIVTSGLAQRGVGFETPVSWLSYALTELKVLTEYARLSIWPSPLVFDYGAEYLVRDPLAVWPQAVGVALTFGVVCWLFVSRRLEAGFLTAAFFVLLSPTSSVVPVANQPMAESRMYLPLVVPVCLLVFALWHRLGPRMYWPLAAIVLAAGVVAHRRNVDYHTEIGIWRDTLAKQPENSRAHNAYAMELRKLAGRMSDAIAHYREALRLNPNNANAHNNLANDLSELPGRLPEAFHHYEAALRIDPKYANAHLNYAIELAKIPQRQAEAIAHFQAAVDIQPDLEAAQVHLAVTLFNSGRIPDAIDHVNRALKQNPSQERLRKTLKEINDVVGASARK